MMSKFERGFSILFLLVLSAVGINLMFTSSAQAQSTTTGAITGRVTDPSGAVIPNATVTLLNNGTNVSRTTTASSDGVYQFALLEPGNYTVSAGAAGFQKVSRILAVDVGQTSAVDFRLPLPTAKQMVTVTTEATLIQTTNGNISATINQAQIAEIPNPGNDMTFIAQMAPGTVSNSQGGFGNVSLYGLPATSNVFTLNGMNDQDPSFNINNSGATNLLLGTNEVAEAAVVQNGYSGEYGSLAGASINYVTKSGTNQFHGNANYYWDGRTLNANNFFNNSTGTPRPFVNANQWALSLGGPIWKDKAWFFVDHEGIRVLLPTNTQAIIPSAAFETATLANLTSLGLTNSIPFYNNMFALYNGAPGASRAENTLPPGTDNNGNPTSNGCSNVPVSVLGPGVPCALRFRSTVGQLTNEWLLNSRIDVNLTSDDRIFVHAGVDRGFQATSTDPINSVFNLGSVQPEQQGQLGWTHLMGANKVNSFRGALQFFSAIFKPADLNAALAAFPGTLELSDGSLTNLGGLNFIAPQGRRDTQYQLIDDFSWIVGKHSLKFGVNYAHTNSTDLDFGILTNPLLLPFSLDDFFNGGGSGDLALQRFPTSPEQPFKVYRLGFYATDQWAVTPNLMLTFTTRFDHASNPVCPHNCFSRLVQPFPSLDHNASIPYNQAIKTGLSHELTGLTPLAVEPRFGFAWRPWSGNNGLVVRGGAGIFYDGIPAFFAENIAENAPLDNQFLVFFDNLSPAESTNLFADASGSNAALLNGFASGGTLASIEASDPAFSPPSISDTARNLHLPRYYEWNFELQKSFGQATMVSINYVGNHGIHENINNGSVNAFCDAACSPTGFAGLPSTVPDARFGTTSFLESAGDSNYEGVVLSFKHNFPSGLITANYTYSHALDDVSNGGLFQFSFSGTGSLLVPQNPNNIRGFYGNADYDIRHNLNMSLVYQLPINRLLFGHFSGPGWDRLVKGWQVSGTVFTHSGFPYTVIDSSATSTLSSENFGGSLLATSRGGSVGNCTGPDRPCLTTSQFQPSTSTPTQFGDSGRNRFRGPGFFNADMGFMKIIPLPRYENAKLSLGVQMFNVFNRVNFSQPVGDIANPQFGQILGTVNPPTSIFGSFLGGDASPRLIQLRARFTF